MILNIYTDWGSRGNPWNSWIWVCIKDKNNVILEKRYKSLGIKTNNEAEYLWAYYGIKRGGELGAKEIYLYMDSSLVIHQLSWKRKIKKETLQKLYTDIQDIIQEKKLKIYFQWIPREKNKEADRLSNLAMDNN